MINCSRTKKLLIVSTIYLALIILAMGIICTAEYRGYVRNYNERLNYLCTIIIEKHPEVTDTEIMEILNSEGTVSKNMFNKYGIDLDKDSVLIQNDTRHKDFLIINGLALLAFALLYVTVLLFIEKKHNREIKEITHYIEQINRGNYQMKIDNNTEGGLSILKNEVYKSTIMLKEAAENSLKDKITIKESMSNISHQLKTPITSLSINLENLEEELGEENNAICMKLITNARRDVELISSLVQSLLKLSKFDANVIQFNSESTDMKQLVANSLENISALADLREIEIIYNEDTENLKPVKCDAFWQKEALTNLMKNAVEHAKTQVLITLEGTKAFTQVSITNDGTPISDKDILHIFEKFYQGENKVNGSDGIGLALAKIIIEKDEGYVAVETGEMTTFTVRYPVW